MRCLIQLMALEILENLRGEKCRSLPLLFLNKMVCRPDDVSKFQSGLRISAATLVCLREISDSPLAGPVRPPDPAQGPHHPRSAAAERRLGAGVWLRAADSHVQPRAVMVKLSGRTLISFRCVRSVPLLLFEASQR